MIHPPVLNLCMAKEGQGNEVAASPQALWVWSESEPEGEAHRCCERNQAKFCMKAEAVCAGRGASPAYILDTSEERHSWQYAMPADSPAGCSRSGCGLGEYMPIEDANSVVAIVGSAHVGGIRREWESASAVEDLSHLLETRDKAE